MHCTDCTFSSEFYQFSIKGNHARKRYNLNVCIFKNWSTYIRLILFNSNYFNQFKTSDDVSIRIVYERQSPKHHSHSVSCCSIARQLSVTWWQFQRLQSWQIAPFHGLLRIWDKFLKTEMTHSQEGGPQESFKFSSYFICIRSPQALILKM